ncbi:MAG: hypothetical protein OEZ36_05050 [Spirochaetota bacterium]|nr:hypothetical protein [Spirochaetota bacterium]
MMKKVIIQLFLFLSIVSILSAQQKEGEGRVYYYESYDIDKNHFTGQITAGSISDFSKYYKVYKSVSGQIIKAEKWEEQKLSVHWIFRGDGSPLYYISYSYDSNGRIFRMEKFSASSYLMEYQNYIYDPSGRVKDIVSYSRNKKELSKRTQRYDPNGRVVEVDVFMYGIKLYTRTYRYDSGGKVILDEKLLGRGEALNIEDNDQVIFVYSLLLGSPSRAADILKSYGVDSPEKVEAFYQKLAALSEDKDFNEKLKAQIDKTRSELAIAVAVAESGPLRTKDGKFKIYPFESDQRVIPYDKVRVLKEINGVSESLEALIEEYNKMSMGEPGPFLVKLTEFRNRISRFHQNMSQTKYGDSEVMQYKFYSKDYMKSLEIFLFTTKKAADTFKLKRAYNLSDIIVVNESNDRINKYVENHNRLVSYISQ